MRLPPLPLRTERRRTLALLALGCVLPAAPCAAAAFDLAALMQMLARVKAGEAKFTERREVAMLDQTSEVSGRLSFQAPDVFVRETLKPRHERLAVNGNVVTMTQGTRSRTMALDAAPEANVVVEAIRGTLTGNRETLERYFEASVAGSPAQWSLELVPREARLRGQVASVRVTGRDASVREMQVLLADGDRTVMKIEPVLRKPEQPGSAAR